MKKIIIILLLVTLIGSFIIAQETSVECPINCECDSEGNIMECELIECPVYCTCDDKGAITCFKKNLAVGDEFDLSVLKTIDKLFLRVIEVSDPSCDKEPCGKVEIALSSKSETEDLIAIYLGEGQTDYSSGIKIRLAEVNGTKADFAFSIITEGIPIEEENIPVEPKPIPTEPKISVCGDLTYFYDDVCPHCYNAEKELEKIKVDQGCLEIHKIHTEKRPDLVEHYNIKEVPSIIFETNYGYKKKIGYVDYVTLINWINEGIELKECPIGCECIGDKITCLIEEKPIPSTSILGEVAKECPKGCICEKDKITCSKEEIISVEGCVMGCRLNDKCVIQGTRIIIKENPSYCDLDSKWQTQKEENKKCQNSYECKTNFCSNDVCYNISKEIKETKNLLQKILDWFKKLFG